MSSNDNSNSQQTTEQVVLPPLTSQSDKPQPEQVTTLASGQQEAVGTVQEQEQIPTIETPEPSIFKEVRDIVVKVSQDHMNEIVKELKNDFLRLEYIDSKGKMQIDRKEYKPMTIGMNKKVVKVGKRLRLLEADIKGMGEQGGMDIGKLQQKYPDILDQDVDEYDISDEAFGEIRATYIVSEKAKIYWGINDIDNYSLHDLMIVESLYESRNNFAPSLQTSQTVRNK